MSWRYNRMKAPSLDEFEKELQQAYQELPPVLRQKVTIVIDETTESNFGYFQPMFPTTINICFKTCKQQRDWRAHVRRVLKHEIEHLLFPGWQSPHSEHTGG